MNKKEILLNYTSLYVFAENLELIQYQIILLDGKVLIGFAQKGICLYLIKVKEGIIMSKEDILKKIKQLEENRELAQERLKMGAVRMKYEIEKIDKKIDYNKKLLESFSDN